MLVDFILTVSVILSVQSIFTILWMLYAWENPSYRDRHKSPRVFAKPTLSFTALVPARFETTVIKDTLYSINNITYPDHLKEIIVLCRTDDNKTIEKIKATIKEIGNSHIHLETFDSFPINKPHTLNIGLAKAKNKIIAIFDAEDHPNKDLYSVVNTIFEKKKVDVVQSGVQLINYRSTWFSIINVMEYFFWFKSGLHFFTSIGKVMPLAGNTVFIQKGWLEKVNGWDEYCLTEDAELGFRLEAEGAKVAVVYDEEHATLEETPNTLSSFVRQRTRWNQGFLQVLFKKEWNKLPSLRQKLFAVYILSSPVMQGFLAGYTPIAVWIMFTQKIPVGIAEFSFIPLYLLVLQLLIYVIGFHEFRKAYGFKTTIAPYIKIAFVFYFYQLVLTFSAFRACVRLAFNKNAWEKTEHLNKHRGIRKKLLLDYVK